MTVSPYNAVSSKMWKRFSGYDINRGHAAPKAYQPTEEESSKDINHRTERTGKGALATESLPTRKQDAQYYLI